MSMAACGRTWHTGRLQRWLNIKPGSKLRRAAMTPCSSRSSIGPPANPWVSRAFCASTRRTAVSKSAILRTRRFCKKPAASEAMYLMMEQAFKLGYRRYEWKCNALNAPSRAAAQRLGFSYEGIFRQATVVKGRNRDTAWYSIIDSEWRALKQAFETWLAPANFDAQGAQRTRLSDLTNPLLKQRG